jgi:hypothetical protein
LSKRRDWRYVQIYEFAAFVLHDVDVRSGELEGVERVVSLDLRKAV